MRWQSRAACLAVVLCPGAGRADMGTPGFKSPELRVVIDNLSDFPAYDLYMVPAGWVLPTEPTVGAKPSQPDPPLAAAQPFVPRGVRHFPNWLLVAVPRQPGAASEVSWEALAGAPGVLRSDPLPLARPETVTELSPVDYEVRHFRIELSGGRLSVTPGPVERRSNGFTSWLPAVLSASAVAVLGLWLARRWLRTRVAP